MRLVTLSNWLFLKNVDSVFYAVHVFIASDEESKELAGLQVSEQERF